MRIRNALITGAGTRLGKAMALALAEDGFNVVVHYHSSAREAEAVAEEIRAMGQGAAVLRADLLDATEVDGLAPAAVAALGGPLTVLVNNAWSLSMIDWRLRPLKAGTGTSGRICVRRSF